MLYVDYLVLCGESVEKAMGKYQKWKEALKGKDWLINVGKTSSMQLLDD